MLLVGYGDAGSGGIPPACICTSAALERGGEGMALSSAEFLNDADTGKKHAREDRVMYETDTERGSGREREIEKQGD